jgi:hypothetical protein
VVYETDPFDSPWTRRALSHADTVLILDDAASTAEKSPIEATLLSEENKITPAKQVLILLHIQEKELPKNTGDWLQIRNLESFFHVRWSRSGDFDRIARLLTGNGIGLVLGGGGSRGFAHIGVIQALEEEGIPIDIVGGTSMGGLVAGEYALGHTIEQMTQSNRNTPSHFLPWCEATELSPAFA